MPAERNSTEYSMSFSPIARHFGALMDRLSGGQNPAVRLAATLVSELTTTRGHVCVDLTRSKIPLELTEDGTPISWPPAPDWIEALRRSPVVGKPGEFRPLILDDGGGPYFDRLL